MQDSLSEMAEIRYEIRYLGELVISALQDIERIFERYDAESRVEVS
jgi:hypothetical protein